MRRHLLVIFSVALFVSCSEHENKQSVAGETAGEAAKAKPAFTDTTACIFSQIAYCPDPQQQLDKYIPGWKVVWNPLAVGGNYAFVATDSITYVVAIRGSLIAFSEDAFNNWISNDLNVTTQDPWPYSKKEKSAVSHGAYLGW